MWGRTHSLHFIFDNFICIYNVLWSSSLCYTFFSLPLLLSPFLSTTRLSLWCVCVCRESLLLHVHHSSNNVTWRWYSTALLSFLWLLKFFHFFFHDGPWALGRVIYRSALGYESSTVTYSGHFDLMNACINCCPLQKEVSLAQVDNSTDLRVQYLEVVCPRVHWQNISSKSCPRACDLLFCSLWLCLNSWNQWEFSCLLWLPHRIWLKNDHPRTQLLNNHWFLGPWLWKFSDLTAFLSGPALA